VVGSIQVVVSVGAISHAVHATVPYQEKKTKKIQSVESSRSREGGGRGGSVTHSGMPCRRSGQRPRQIY
jgi:hypothetical protein